MILHVSFSLLNFPLPSIAQIRQLYFEYHPSKTVDVNQIIDFFNKVKINYQIRLQILAIKKKTFIAFSFTNLQNFNIRMQ